MQKKLKVDYKYQNWGKTERIVCEEDLNEDEFILLKQEQVVGTIKKTPEGWTASPNTIFLKSEIDKIGNYLETCRKKQNHPSSTYED